jgi:Glycerol kinase
MLNTGAKVVTSKNRLLATIAYRLNGITTYAVEGSIFSAGSIVQWLRDKLGLVKTANDTEALAAGLPDNDGVYFVPAFTGLGAPYWDPKARASIEGLNRDSQVAHIVRAGLEAVAYETRDLLNAMIADGATGLSEIRVDGGMVVNNWLMQFLADMLQLPVERALVNESTALGVAYLAGLQVGIFHSTEQISKLWQCERQFVPVQTPEWSESLYKSWQTAVRRVLTH